MSDFVSLLGVKGGPAIRPGSNMPTAILLRMGGRTILVDAGLGAARGVCDQGVALTQIDMILITHLHSDHYLELGPLLHTAWTAGLNRTVPVYGPPGTETYWQGFLASMAFDIELRIRDEGRPDLAQLVRFHTLEPGEVLNDDGLSVTALRNCHPPIEDSFALRFDANGKAVVLSGDTAPLPGLAEFCAGADLLVHEAMLTEGVDLLMQRMTNGDDRLRSHILRSHTDAADVGRLASEAGVKRLAINHMVPDGFAEFTEDDWRAKVRRHWDGPLEIGRDGMRLTL
ncbi:MBL fold metallo-hydrolase [Aestuariicoccus sp. MJ-SS9]|uniref:MBL fold metallo-hydrolase n=1 Tax=Aestuariicoccus sp. MJ-SS9 TaxID=3079855 RepID=UPI00290674F7|nr:MBL fold metallo-hydrolase [Aestuariicoccus sp. MJ-SS9]MDU8909961.1 MBL fold metallo-hydrolase [Aestuariicoccus sp. MJ-SS9]